MPVDDSHGRGTVRTIPIRLSPPQPIAQTSAYLWEPATSPTSVVVLGHGAGSTREAPILAAVGRALAASGVATVAFNFAYAELGRRGPDPMPRLQSAYRDAIAVASDLVPGAPLVLGGRSMGGRVGSMVAAGGAHCAGLLLLGYPLHPPGRPDRLRVDHWPDLKVPVLFVSGTRDSFFTLELFDEHRSGLRGDVTLHLLDGADHGFHVRKMDGRSDAEAIAEVCDVSVRWVHRVTAA